MIKSLRIQNFKSWKDTGEIELAPLTVFFGTNSSGKSSIGQFLLLLKQTVENRDNKVVLNLGGDKESPVNLGSFSELIHRGQKNSKLIFDIGWDIEKDKIEIKPGKKNEKVLPIKFSAEIGYESGIMKLYSFKYLFKNDVLISAKRSEGDNNLFAIDKISPIIKKNRGIFKKEIGKFYMFPDTLDSLFEKPDIIRNLNYSISDLLSNIFYLGPIRISPERMYLWPGNAPYDVGFRGEHTVAALMGAEKNKLKIISPKLGIYSKEFSKVITNWLGSDGDGLGLIKDFKIERIRDSKESKEVELKISTYKGSPEVNLTDVGFGISQVLPVIVQCYYAPMNSTILLEQPELHLHPKAQTGLADLFLDVVESKTSDKQDRNIQLVVESHSEHFLTRLQRRIAEDETNQLKEKVSLYFCSNENGESKIEKLEINKFGDIQNWPTDFFGDTLGETLSRAEAGSKKRKEASKNEKK